MADRTFDHVVLNLMNLSSTLDCYLCLIENGVSSARDIATLEETAIKVMTFSKGEDPDKKISSLPLYQRQLLRIVGDFVRHLRIENKNRLNDDVILASTKEEWDDFRISSREARKSIDVNVFKKNNSNNGNMNNLNGKSNELNNFIKGIKRDKTQYNEFKDERNFESWKRSFLATARSHRIDDVFNSRYVPISIEDTEVFHEKKNLLSPYWMQF